MKQRLRTAGGSGSRTLPEASQPGEPDPPEAPRPGLRERKKRRLLSEIQRTALRLFVEQGYEETTIEQIAEAVEVSPSTVFRYFPTKEDLVLTDEYDPLIIAAIAAGPANEPPVAAVRRAITETLGGIADHDPTMFLDRGRLMLDVPSLRARLWDFLQQNEGMLAQLFAAQSGRDPHDLELRVAAAAITGALMVALTDWIQSDGKADMAELLDRALRQLEVGLGRVGG